MRAAHDQRGFTFIELSIVSAIFAGMMLLFTRSFASTNDLVAVARLDSRVQDESRRNLESIADAVRGGAVASLTGFNVSGVSTDMTFQCVTGAVGGTRTLDAAQEMKWVATSAAVNGIANPGQVVVIKSGVTTVVARRVPQNGFSVLQQGNTLLVTLTTYDTTTSKYAKTVSGSISISLRN